MEGAGEEMVGRYRHARSISVDAEAVAVTIHATHVDDLVEVRLADRRDRTRPDLLDIERDGDLLRIRVHEQGAQRWSRGRRTSGLRLSIGAPAGMPVAVRTEAGAVRVVERSGMVRVDAAAGAVKLVDCSGDASVRTDAGAIKVERHRAGTLTLETSAGAVKSTDTRVAVVRAVTEVGTIALEFAEPPSDVDARCAVGSVQVVLPPERYRIEHAASGLGRSSVEGVEHDPRADRVVRVAAHGLGSARIVGARIPAPT